MIPAAKKPGPGRPRKTEKEPWRARIPSTYSRFVKEAYAQAEKDVSDVKNATSVMPSIAKLWREAPQSQKDRCTLRTPAFQRRSPCAASGRPSSAQALKLCHACRSRTPSAGALEGGRAHYKPGASGACAVLCSRVCLPRVLLRGLRRRLPRDNTHLGYHTLTASDRTPVSVASAAPAGSLGTKP